MPKLGGSVSGPYSIAGARLEERRGAAGAEPCLGLARCWAQPRRSAAPRHPRPAAAGLWSEQIGSSCPASSLVAPSVSSESSGLIHSTAKKNTLCVLSVCYLVQQLPCGSFWCLLVAEQGSSIKREIKVVPCLPALTGVLSRLCPTNLIMPSCLSEWSGAAVPV